MSQSLFEKRMFCHLRRKFPTSCGTQKFFTVSTIARHLSLLWVRSIQSMLPSHFLRVHFDIILQSLSRSSKWSLYCRFRTKNPYAILLFSIRATCSAHLILLYLVIPKTFGEQYRSFSTSLCSFLYSLLASSLLDPNIFLSTLLRCVMLTMPIAVCTELIVLMMSSKPARNT